ncbi:MAG: hypothetical protein ACRDZP_06015 [Acidimicrobiales bacterium]
MADRKTGASGTKTEVTELVGLVKTYVLQETLGPLKQIARTLAFGSAAAVMLGIGAVLFLVALLRVLEAQSIFAGQWNWAPYLLTAAAALIFLGAAGALLLRSPRSEKM